MHAKPPVPYTDPFPNRRLIAMTDAPAEPRSAAMTTMRKTPNYVLGMLLLVYIFNFLDRQIVTTLAEPIKVDLGLTDTQIGLMTGLAFAVFYTVRGIPIARLADRAN